MYVFPNEEGQDNLRYTQVRMALHLLISFSLFFFVTLGGPDRNSLVRYNF